MSDTALENIAPGLLIAMPQLRDPNFHRMVVLMLEHNDEGSFGVVINNPVEAAVALQTAESTDAPVIKNVYIGGPVAPHVCMVLHSVGWRGERTKEVVKGLCVSEPSAAVPCLIEAQTVPFRFIMGYAGWGPGQLTMELARGAWLCSPVTAEQVLIVDPEDQWDQVIRDLGVDPMMLVPATRTQ